MTALPIAPPIGRRCRALAGPPHVTWDADRMRHGYTNDTQQRGDVVVKTYDGPRAEHRQQSEVHALHMLAGWYPVAPIADIGEGWMSTSLVGGRHGQELIDDGRARPVLAACGRALAALHCLAPGLLDAQPPVGAVIQHGDFGPNNILLDAQTCEVTAVLDWEFCTLGDPITDIAWCEWIVRMHHPDAVDALEDFFHAYGQRPSWVKRQDEMLRRCAWFEEFTREWNPNGPGVVLWQERARTTQNWRE